MLTTARVFALSMAVSTSCVIAVAAGLDSSGLHITAEDAVQNEHLDTVDHRLMVLEEKSDRNLEAVHVNSLQIASLQSETRVWFEILSAIIAAGIGTLTYIAKRIFDSTALNRQAIVKLVKSKHEKDEEA